MILEKLFKEYIADINTYSTEQSEQFDQYFEKVLIKKNSFLIKEGEVEKYSYFIFEGIARCWVLDHSGIEQTFWFCDEGTFSMSNISFTLQEKSTFNVQLVSDSVIYKINKENLDELYKQIPSLKELFENFTAKLLSRVLNRNVDLLKYTPEQYYLKMIDEYGTNINQIPLKYISSYLGITPQALSRIRKRIY